MTLSTEELWNLIQSPGLRGEKITNLPVEVIEYTLTEEETACPQCGEELHVMSKEVRKELTIIPATVKVIEHASYVYSCQVDLA